MAMNKLKYVGVLYIQELTQFGGKELILCRVLSREFYGFNWFMTDVQEWSRKLKVIIKWLTTLHTFLDSPFIR